MLIPIRIGIKNENAFIVFSPTDDKKAKQAYEYGSGNGKTRKRYYAATLLAEGEGFEPPVPSRVQRFSRPPR